MANTHASSSRPVQTARRARREVSPSSPISSDGEDSEAERRTKPRISAQTKGTGSRGSDGPAGDDLEGWTEETYQPHPLGRDAALVGKLQAILTQIQTMQFAIDKSIEKAMETAVAVEDCSPGDDMIEEIAQGVCRSIEIKHVLGIRHAVLNSIRAKLAKGDEIHNVTARLESQTASQTAEYMSKTVRQKFAQDEKYVLFRREIWQQNHPNEACPPMSHWLDRAEADESDDDLEMGPNMEHYRCDITHVPIRDATYNPACNHHYSREAIEGLFAQHTTSRGSRAHIKCPAVGCSKLVYKNELRADPDFQAKADQYLIRETQREAQEAQDVEELSE